MTTDFFKHIAALGTPGNWKITIATTDNINLVVSVHFSAPHGSDQAADIIPPLLFKNTPEKLGETFFRDIADPIRETAGIYNNMEAYKKAVELAKQKSKEQQDKKRNEQTTNKKESPVETEEQKQLKEEMKRYYDEAMMVVAGYMPHMKYAEALEALPTVEDYPEKKAELAAKRQELEKLVKLKEQTLFAFNNA